MVPLPDPLGPSIVTIGALCILDGQRPLQTLAMQTGRARQPDEPRKGGRHVRDVQDLEGLPGAQSAPRKGHGDPVIPVAIDPSTAKALSALDPDPVVEQLVADAEG